MIFFSTILGLFLAGYVFVRHPPRFLINKFGKMVESGYANCLIFAFWKYWTCGGKIVLQDTQRNRSRWIVWWHVGWKKTKCPTNGVCVTEESFEPINGPDVWLPKFLFRGRVVKKGIG